MYKIGDQDAGAAASRGSKRLHLLGDPAFEFREVDRWQLRQVRSQSDGVFDIDVANFALCAPRIPVDEDADAATERAGHVELMGAEERYVEPAELARCECWEFSIDIHGRTENRTGHILRLDLVEADHQCEQLAGRGENFIATVFCHRGRSPHAATEERCGWRCEAGGGDGAGVKRCSVAHGGSLFGGSVSQRVRIHSEVCRGGGERRVEANGERVTGSQEHKFIERQESMTEGRTGPHRIFVKKKFCSFEA